MLRKLKYGTFEDVIVSPRPGRLPVHGGGLAFPALYPKYCRHRRYKGYFDNIVDIGDKDLPRLKSDDERPYVWGGVYQWSFGHTLAEFVHRLWVLELDNLADLTVLFVAQDTQTYVTDYFKQIMAYLDVRNWKIISEPSIIDSLLIAEQGKSLGRKSHPHYTAYLSRLAEKHHLIEAEWPLRKDKVAILRGHLSGRRYLGEQHLATYLAEQGYYIFESEKHPIDLQLKTIANAKKIILSDGSACHLMDLLPKIDAEVAFLARSSKAHLGKTSLRPKTSKFHSFKDAIPLIMPKTKDDIARKAKALLYADLRDIIDFLKRHHFLKRDAKDISPASNRADIDAYLSHFEEGIDFSIPDDALFLELYGKNSL